MFNINSPPVFSTCIQGRHFLAYPIYYIRIPSETKPTEIQEIKFEEKKQILQVEIHKQRKESQTHTTNNNSFIYPGQTKNYYKTLGNKLSAFIQNNFDDIETKNDQYIQKFIKVNNQKCNKNHFRQLIKSKLGKQIMKIYFGNYLWCQSALKFGKSNLDFYLTLNKQIFKRKPKQKQTQQK